MKYISYYEVYDCFSADGRGSNTTIGCFDTFAIATDYAKRRGNYKNDAHVREINVTVFDSVKEKENYSEISTKYNALHKMTQNERSLLGLSEQYDKLGLQMLKEMK